MDLWASPTLRTGGEDVAHALALMGVRPVWDHASTRVTGFEILPLAMLDRPRIDVTVRVSGAFRDTFPETRWRCSTAPPGRWPRPRRGRRREPLAAARRRGDAAVQRLRGGARSLRRRHRRHRARRRLGRRAATSAAPTLAASSHAYGDREGPDADFAARVAAADAYLHAFDVAERDLFDGDAAVDAMGGFAAAAALEGRAPPSTASTCRCRNGRRRGRPGRIPPA
ncbi:cobaltochelatase subunit CobN [Methylobacterium oryzae CBMB20]